MELIGGKNIIDLSRYLRKKPDIKLEDITKTHVLQAVTGHSEWTMKVLHEYSGARAAYANSSMTVISLLLRELDALGWMEDIETETSKSVDSDDVQE